jgi:hypothetical protein
MVQENQNVFQLTETHQQLIVVDLLREDVDRKKNKSLLDGSKEVGLEVKAKKTKYMLMPRHYSALQIHNVKISNKYRKKVSQSSHI